MNAARRPTPDQDLGETSAVVRLSDQQAVLYEGEMSAGQSVELADGLRLELLWIRKHTAAKK
jgi:hypothetical protein